MDDLPLKKEFQLDKRQRGGHDLYSITDDGYPLGSFLLDPDTYGFLEELINEFIAACNQSRRESEKKEGSRRYERSRKKNDY